MKGIDPLNLTAQFAYRAAGNPPVTMADSAISNCYPGLECDFRNVWRNIFEGIVLHEADNYVVAAEPAFAHLVNHRLLFVEDDPIIVKVVGPNRPGADPVTLGASSLEWSNALARKLMTPGTSFDCYFTPEASTSVTQPAFSDDLKAKAIKVRLKMRSFFAGPPEARLPVISDELLRPGDLTQSLCSPWQNDYRECACYYWAASRPDYVNVEAGDDGLSQGHNWMEKDRSGPKNYLPDDRKDSRLWSYEDLFGAWQRVLKFQVGGRDYEK